MQHLIQHLDWPASVRSSTCATPCTQPSHYVCPARGPEEPHHLAVRGPACAREHFCAHCGRTEKELRESIAGA